MQKDRRGAPEDNANQIMTGAGCRVSTCVIGTRETRLQKQDCKNISGGVNSSTGRLVLTFSRAIYGITVPEVVVQRRHIDPIGKIEIDLKANHGPLSAGGTTRRRSVPSTPRSGAPAHPSSPVSQTGRRSSRIADSVALACHSRLSS